MISEASKKFTFYMNELEINKLNAISQKRGLSKSACLREFILNANHLKCLEKIEENNEIFKEILYELNKMGININQIATHLNMGISVDEENLTKKIDEIKNNLRIIKTHLAENVIYQNLQKQRKNKD